MPHLRFDSDERCFHVDAKGEALYPARDRAVSSYSDGLAVAHQLDGCVCRRATRCSRARARRAEPIEPLLDDKRMEMLTFWGLEHLKVPA